MIRERERTVQQRRQKEITRERGRRHQRLKRVPGRAAERGRRREIRRESRREGGWSLQRKRKKNW